MSKHLRCIGACLCLLFSMTMQAEKGPYGIFSEKDTTLTVYYGDIPEDAYRYDPTVPDNSDVWLTPPSGSPTNLGKLTKVRITKSFRDYKPTSLKKFFAYFTNFRTVEGINNMRTETVTDMSEMFSNCKSLKEIDLRSFNTSSVVSMRRMFYECRALTSVDLTTFNTSSVSDMYGMFWQSALETIDLSSFNTRQAMNMGYMFFNMKSLKTVIVGSDWLLNSSSLDAVNMFEYCEKIQGGKGTTYDESHVDHTYAHVDGGAENPGYLTFNGELKKVPYAVGTYSKNTHRMNKVLLGFDTLEIKYGYLPVSGNANSFELNCDGKTWWRNDVDSFFVYSRVIRIDPSMKEYPLKTTAYLFAYCSSVRYLSGLNNLNTDSVTDMTGMFYQCDALGKYLDFKGFNTRNVTKMDSMFANMGVCIPEDEMKDASNGERKKYRYTLDLRELDTRNVTSMEKMFYQLYWVDTLDISSFDTRKVTNMSNMFRDGPNNYIASGESFLKTIYVGDNWSTASLINTEAGIFGGVSALFGGAGTYKDVLCDFYGYEVARVDGGIEKPGLFTSHNPKTYPEIYGVLEGRGNLYYFVIRYGVPPKNAYRFKCEQAPKAERVQAVYNYDTNSWVNESGGKLNAYGVDYVEIDSTVRNCSPKTLASFFAAFARANFIEGLENLRTDSVRSLKQMFCGCESLKTLELQSFKTRSVKNVSDMFFGCKELKTIYVGKNWTLSNLTDSTVKVFENCPNLVGGERTQWSSSKISVAYARIDERPDNPGYFTYKGPQSYGIFSEADSTFTIYYGIAPEEAYIRRHRVYYYKWEKTTEEQLPMYGVKTAVIDPSFRTSRENTLGEFFNDFYDLETIIGIENIMTDSVTDMSSMFSGCEKLKSVDLSNFNTSRVKYMNAMFSGCESLTELNVSNFDTRNVEDMAGMFNGCKLLTELNVSNFDTRNVERMLHMFKGCSLLKTLDLENFDTRNVTEMDGMFDHIGVDSLDLRSFDTRKVTRMTKMFTGSKKLRKIVVGYNWVVDTLKVDGGSMFTGLKNLVGGAGTVYDANHIDDTYAHIDGGEENPGYLTGATLRLKVNVENSVGSTVEVSGYKYIDEEGRYCFDIGSTAQLTAVPGEGCVVKCWSDDFRSLKTRYVKMTQDTAIAAVFYEIFTVDSAEYIITSVDPAEVGVYHAPYTKGDYTVPEKVEHLGKEFAVTTIKNGAYSLCLDLTSVTIPSTVTSIEHSAFDSCVNLTNVVIPNTVTKIDKYAFVECPKLNSVVIPSSVTTIGIDAFGSSYSGMSKHLTIYCRVEEKPKGWDSDWQRNQDVVWGAKFVTIQSNDAEQGMVLINGKYTSADTTVVVSVNDEKQEVKVEAKPVEKYEFVQWNDGVTDNPRTFAITADTTITAIFEKQDIPLYVLTYKVDGEVYQQDSIAFGDTVVAIKKPTKEGYTFNGWKNVPTTMPAKNVTVTGSFKVNSYVITYKVDGEVYQQDSIAFGDTVVAIKKPTKEGYTFNGWKNVPTTMPAKNVTVTGSFKAKNYVITYKVDDKVYQTDTLAYGETIVAAEEPTKEGATFSGWSKLPETMPAKDLIVTGTFSGKSYVITYKVDGKVYQKDTLNAGSTVVAGEEPKKEGYTFIGWKNLTDTMPSQNVTVTAMFVVNTYALTYKVDGEVYQQDSIAFGDTVVAIKKPTKEGYTFNGWKNVPTTMPAKNVTVTGSFKAKSYVITYKVDDKVYQTDTVAYGETIVAAEEPTKEGATFSGWSKLPETMPAKDLIVTGTFSGKSYVITYKVDGKVYKRDTMAYGATILAPEVDEKEGYTFSGWNNLPETMPAKNVTVTGTFSVNSYIITYKVDDKVYQVDTVVYGDTIVVAKEPKKSGSTFSGWSKLPVIMPARDLTVTGTFSGKSYILTYKLDGKVYQRDTLTYGATIVAPEPEKTGYTFSGWNKLPETMPAKNTTVEGTFSINSYILTYIVDEDVYYTDTLQYGATITEIEAPEKKNYVFNGWIELPETMPAVDLTVMASFRPYSGVAEYNSDAIRVWTADKTIYIQTENTASYIIYNMLGHVMAQGEAEGEAQVAMPVQGVYQVVVNKRRHTVLVR
ncbi:MAG: BspA family leucine-rich repeat surface protein [Paludibacteraceae bacterium]|nr:BspA family leucine-rich repeat surface protein [Paludibacteraceae bacterium]